METLKRPSVDKTGASTTPELPTLLPHGLPTLKSKWVMELFTTNDWEEIEWLSWVPTLTLASSKESITYRQAATNWKLSMPLELEEN